MSYEASANLPRAAVPTADAVAPAGVGIVTDRAEWDRLVAAAAFPHLPQSWSYGEGKRAKGWEVVRAAFSIGGQVVAFAQVLERRALGIRLVSRINRGPVFLEAEPREAIVAAVYAALRRRWGRFWHGAFFLAPALPSGEPAHRLLAGLGFRHRHDGGWTSARLDLTRPEAEIFASFDSRFRNRYRGAERAGASCRIAGDADTLDWMIARHNENMRDKHFHGVDGTFLRGQAAAAGGDMPVFQLIHDGRPVAGMIVQRFGTRCEYHIGWFGEGGRKVNAGNYLMWQIVVEMKRRGCTEFDVGGLAEGSGYTQFKRLMNGTEYRLAGEWISF